MRDLSIKLYALWYSVWRFHPILLQIRQRALLYVTTCIVWCDLGGAAVQWGVLKSPRGGGEASCRADRVSCRERQQCTAVCPREKRGKRESQLTGILYIPSRANHQSLYSGLIIFHYTVCIHCGASMEGFLISSQPHTCLLWLSSLISHFVNPHIYTSDLASLSVWLITVWWRLIFVWFIDLSLVLTYTYTCSYKPLRLVISKRKRNFSRSSTPN